MIDLALIIMAALGVEPSPPPASQTQLALLTAYDPFMCDAGVVCVQGNGDMLFANLEPVTADGYFTVAACPMELHGATIALPSLGLEVECWDTFGEWNGEPVDTMVLLDSGEWVIRLDVMYPYGEMGEPDWNYWAVPWEFSS